MAVIRDLSARGRRRFRHPGMLIFAPGIEFVRLVVIHARSADVDFTGSASAVSVTASRCWQLINQLKEDHMTTTHPWRTAAVIAAGWLLGCGAVTAPASEILDQAKFFSPAAVTKATDDLNRLEKRAHLGTHIETHDSLPADKQAAFAKLGTKQERDKFFYEWLVERSKATGAKGVFVLITRNPSHLQVAADAALRNRGFSNVQREEISKGLIARFSQKEFDSGLQDTVANLERIALRLGEPRRITPAAAHQVPAGQRAPVGAPAAGGGQGMGILGWVILGGVVLLVFSVISAIIRSVFGGGQAGPGPGGYPQGGGYAPGYGGGGYGGGYGGGGGFFSNMMGGLAGAMAGNWLYNSMGGGHHSGQASAGDWTGGGGGNYIGGDEPGAGDFSGGDSSFGGGDFGGGDFGGGGGDFGGGDFGGGGDF